MAGDMDDLPQEARDAAPSSGSDFPVLPKGDYPAVVFKHEVQDYPEKGGKTHAFTFAITQGEFKGQKQFKKLYFYHPDPKERAKTNGFFASLKQATGVTPTNGGRDFVDKKVTLAVGLMVPKEPNSEPFNFVANVKPEHNGPVAPATIPGQLAPAGNANPFGSVA